MPAWASLAIASVALILYGYCFIRCYLHPDGRGRLYLLLVFGCLCAYFAFRVVGYAGLTWHFMTGLQVNEVFRWAGYILLFPGIWIAARGWRG